MKWYAMAGYDDNGTVPVIRLYPSRESFDRGDGECAMLVVECFDPHDAFDVATDVAALLRKDYEAAS